MAGSEPPAVGETIVKMALSAVPYVGGSLTVLYDDVRSRRLAKLEQSVQAIADATGLEALVHRLDESPEIEALFVEALDAAARTASEAKRALLTRVVTEAVSDDAKIEPGQLIVQAFRDLDSPQIRALARLRAVEVKAEREHGSTTVDRRDEVGSAVTAAGRLEPDPVVAALVRTGVVHPAALYGGGLAVYGVSPFGRMLLLELAQPEDA